MELSGKRCVAFCGIGYPEGFRQTLDSLGVRLSQFAVFPDHHQYTAADLQTIAGAAEDTKAEFIVTTEKDAMRLLSSEAPGPFRDRLWLYIVIELTIGEGESVLHDLLNRALMQAAKC